MGALITLCFLGAGLLVAVGLLWWAYDQLTKPQPMAIDLREDDMTLRIKATCKRGGHGYAITEDQEHA